MTKEELDNIKERVQNTTFGDWFVDALDIGSKWNIQTEDGTDIALAQEVYKDDKVQSKRSANAEFIAHAKRDIICLIETLEALNALKEFLKE